MPWPGPHATFSIQRLVAPGSMEKQSSPVLICVSMIVTPEDNCTWMPSVLGFFLEAETLTTVDDNVQHLAVQ